MADSEALGDLLSGAAGHPIDRPGLNAAVMQGQALAGLRTAQTEDALLNAQRMREEQDAGDQLESTLASMTDPTGKPIMSPSQAKFTATQMKFLHGGAQPALEAVNQAQKNTAFSTVADPNADPNSRLAAMQAASMKPESAFTNVGDQLVGNMGPTAATAPNVIQTPVSQADVALKNAQTTNPGAFHPGGAGTAGRPPVNEQWAKNPDGTPKLDDNGNPVAIPITGSPTDPDFKRPMSAVERRYFQTSLNSATGAIAELNNVMNLKTGANAGIMGIGAHNGQSALGTVAANARNAIASEDVQLYNTRINNLSRMMATVENTGRMPPGTAVEAINQMQLQPGDTEATRLTKLAQGRQNLDAALNTWLNTAPLNGESKAYVYSLLAKLHTAIPFTVEDVDSWQQSKDPHATIKDEVKNTVGSVPSASDGTTTNNAAPPVNLLSEGHITHFDNGQKWALRNGVPVQVP